MIDAADEAMTDRRQPRALTGRWSTGAVVRMVLIGLCLGAMLAYPRLERAYEVQIGDRDRATLELATQNLRGALNRAAVLPPASGRASDPGPHVARSDQCGALALCQ